MSKFTDTEFRKKFWSQVDQGDSCWLWTGSINHNGYGHFFARIDEQTYYRAHRYVWALFNGDIPEGHVVMHSCDVRHCVNPHHLSCATQADNLADRDSKGRAALGSKQGHSKLTELQAHIAKYSSITPTELGNRWNVHPTCITAIRRGRNWKHI